MNGYEATRHIRENEQYNDLPIIAISAHVLNEDVNPMQENGMQGLITKPIEPQLLFNTLLDYAKNIDEDTHGSQTDRSILYPQIEGLDTKLGFVYAAYDLNRYHEMLNDFTQHYLNADKEIKHLLVQGNFHTASQTIVKLRRVLGNIGAKSLHEKLRDLNKCVKTENISTKIVEEFIKDFEILTTTIQTYLKSIQHEVIFSEQIDSVELLHVLRKKLEESDFEAIEHWNDYKLRFKSILGDHASAKISKLLSSFEFEYALKILNEASHEHQA